MRDKRKNERTNEDWFKLWLLYPKLHIKAAKKQSSGVDGLHLGHSCDGVEVSNQPMVVVSQLVSRVMLLLQFIHSTCICIYCIHSVCSMSSHEPLIHYRAISMASMHCIYTYSNNIYSIYFIYYTLVAIAIAIAITITIAIALSLSAGKQCCCFYFPLQWFIYVYMRSSWMMHAKADKLHHHAYTDRTIYEVCWLLSLSLSLTHFLMFVTNTYIDQTVDRWLNH